MRKYDVQYACVSNVGRRRGMNQDNFICMGSYMEDHEKPPEFPLSGRISPGPTAWAGVFDGMGGEACGEVASLLAAREACATRIGEDPVRDLREFCVRANEAICGYMEENGISSMGTTGAMLAFGEEKIALCNIGDSRIFRYADRKLEQLSMDHVVPSPYNVKAPLSQCLGIPASEMRIEPYFALGEYGLGDVYLICSDGLTDMVSTEEIAGFLREPTAERAAEKLVKRALENGGKDNVTVIVCRIVKGGRGFFRK